MQLSQILIGPIVTEKAVRLQERNQHTFLIHSQATKIDVMNALTRFYAVTPTGVQILYRPKKIRMVGRSRFVTKRQRQKIAIVQLPQGQSIELVSVKKAEKKTAEKKSTPAQKTAAAKKKAPAQK